MNAPRAASAVNSSPSPAAQGVRMLVGIALTVTLLAWALRGFSPASVWSAFQTAEIGWLGLSVLSLLASVSVRACRWGTLLKGQCNPGSFDLRQSAVFIGCAGNYLLPMHAGELVRGLVLQRRGGVSLGLGLGSIVVERILDVIVLLAFLVVSVFLGQVSRPASIGLDGWRLGCAGIALVVVGGGIFVVVLRSERIAGLVENICIGLGLRRFSPHVVGGVRALIDGLGVLRSPRLAGTAFFETVLIVALSVIMFWSAMAAFGITAPGIPGAVMTQSVTTLGMAIPSAPGYIGTFEAAIRVSLELYQVPADSIIAYALAFHALVFVTLVAAGGVLALRMGLSWSDMATPSSTEPQQPAEHKAVA